MKLSALLQTLGCPTSSLITHPELDPEILGVGAIDSCKPGQLSYLEGSNFTQFLATTPAIALILPENSPLKDQVIARNIPWIESKNARMLFAQTIALFYQPYKPKPQIHPSAIIDPSAKIGENVAIGAHAVIGENVIIGDDCCIFPNVVIYPDCVIGDRTQIHANATIEERTLIGKGCIIHSGSVIGCEGFGYVPTREGWYKMQQSGHVVLEDRVDIGATCTIDRPAVGETRIGADTKFDDAVHIGHGCTVGKGCAFAGQVALAGGVEIGDRVILAGQVGVANNIKMASGSIATAKAGVTSDVAPGQTVSGYPSMDHRIFLKMSGIYSRIPELYQWYRRVRRDRP
jgi:UDP-3-O-[3-hydroxymyristoyl] glucosamine N-acyltransferase